MERMDQIRGTTWPPVSGQPATGLVVLLHGYGACGAGWIPLVAQLQHSFADLAFAIPDGPFQIGQNSFAWIPLSLPLRLAQLWKGIVSVTPALEQYLNTELTKLGLGPDKLLLAGFSQGAILALHVGLRRAVAPLGIVSMAGFLVGQQPLREVSSVAPVYLLSGELDPLVTPAQVHQTHEALLAAGIPVWARLIPGLAHSIDQTLIHSLMDILQQVTTKP